MKTAKAQNEYAKNADAIDRMIDAVRRGGRGGVVELENRPYPIERAIIVQNCPGLEIRGPGGHCQTYDAAGLASIVQMDPAMDAINYVSHGEPRSSLILRNLAIHGTYKNHPSNPTEPKDAAGIAINTLDYAHNLVLDNVYIGSMPYGIRTGYVGRSYGISHVTIDRSRIERCFWGVSIRSKNSGSTCIHIATSSIRANGNYAVRELNYSAIERGGGVHVENAAAISVARCNLEANSTGLRLDRVFGGNCDNNLFEANATAAVVMSDCDGVSVRNEMSTGNQSYSYSHRLVLRRCVDIDYSGWASHSGEFGVIKLVS